MTDKVGAVLGSLTRLQPDISAERLCNVTALLHREPNTLDAAYQCLQDAPVANLWLLEDKLPAAPAFRRVLYIMGTSYSGSTLLNCLLDSQPGIRGLSEACHWFRDETNAYCMGCQAPLQQCRNYDRLYKQPRFYEELFAIYPDAYMLVNSSKHPSHAFRLMALPPIFIGCQMLVLYKYPHEFAWSYTQHAPSASVRDCFEAWADVNTFVYQYVIFNRDQGGSTPCPKHLQEAVPTVCYRNLVTDTEGEMQKLMNSLELPFDAEALSRMWENGKRTCAVGGNTAVYAQRTGNAEFFTSANQKYLQGKYVGRMGVMFLDRQWRQDSNFLADCRKLYADEALARRIELACIALGEQKRVNDFVQDLS